MKHNHSLIHIENCQIKSLEKAKKLAALLNDLEIEIGICRVEISFKNCFICPDIDMNELIASPLPMENLLGNLLSRIKSIEVYGKP